MSSPSSSSSPSLADFSSSFSPYSLLFVSADQTVADVALNVKASAGLSTSIATLMGILVSASFFLNSALFATIFSSRRLRANLLFLMFCMVALLNLLDVLLIMLISLLYVANGAQWTFGEFLCRLNAFAQQFTLLANLFALTLMAVQRALILVGRHLINPRFFGVLSLLFAVTPLCFSAPLFLPSFPVSLYPFRYLCAIGSNSPVLYSFAQMLVYGGCLFVLLLCFSYVLKHKRTDRRTLPAKPQDYGAFIIRSRALEEHMNLSRVVLLLVIQFVLIEGPYISLNFFMQIRNSVEIRRNINTELQMPQDLDTLITLIKLFHPLFVPMTIFACCADIWTKFTNLICFRGFHRVHGAEEMAWSGQAEGTEGSRNMGGGPAAAENVFTLFATAEGGLQLRIPYSNDIVSYNQFPPKNNGIRPANAHLPPASQRPATEDGRPGQGRQ